MAPVACTTQTQQHPPLEAGPPEMTVPHHTTRTRWVSGVFWTMIAFGAGQGSSFFSAILAARLLGRETYGKLAMIQSVVLTLTGLAGLGLGTTATKFVSELRSRDPERVGRILGLCSVLTALTGAALASGLFLLAPWIASELLKAADLGGPLRIVALSVLFLTLNGYQVGAINGFEAFSRLAWISGVQGPVVIVLTVGLTWAMGLHGAVWAGACAAASAWALHQYHLRGQCAQHAIRITYRGLAKEAPVLLRFATPAALSDCTAGLAIAGAHGLLVRTVGGFLEMAVFNAANTIRLLVLTVPRILTRVARPLLCNLRVAADERAYRRAFWRYVGSTTATAAGMAVVCLLGGPYLLAIFGKGFEGGRAVLAVVLLSAVLETLGASLAQTAFGRGRMWTHLAITLGWAATLLGGTWCGAGFGGAMGLAAAYLAAWTSVALLHALLTRRLLRQPPDPQPPIEMPDATG